MRITLRFVAGMIAATLFGSAFGVTYTSKPKVMELSRRLIVKPIQIDTLINKGHTYSKLISIYSRSRNRLIPNLIRYEKSVDLYIVRVPANSTDSKYATQLLNTGDYEYVEPDWKLYPLATTPSDPLYPNQWHHPVIQADKAWDIWQGSSDFITGYVDTGVFKAHPDLQGLWLPGYNSVDKKAEADGGDVSDVHGHGTHVAGDGSAHGNNNVGVSGVGWNFSIIPVRATNGADGYAYQSDLLDGARWAVEHGAKTVSISYAGVGTQAIEDTGTYIKGIGGLLFFAAGNDGRNLTDFQYRDTVVVGASNPLDAKADFSAYGHGVNVFAPGVGILSTTREGSYEAWDGTSMATPVCNGTVALMWSANPDLTPDDVQSILYETCDNIGDSAIYGHGRINAYQALLTAIASQAQTVQMNAVSVQQGTYTQGALTSINDSDDASYYGVRSATVRSLGEAAGSYISYQLPTDTPLRRATMSVTLGIEGNKPVSYMLFLKNISTGVYTQVASRSALSGSVVTLNFDLTSYMSKYIAADGTVNCAVRAVVPTRFSPSSYKLKVMGATAKYLKALGTSN